MLIVDHPEACPEGSVWLPFDDAAGKVVIGAGQGTLNTPNEPPVTLSQREYRVQGGEEVHVLTPDELAVHSHGFSQAQRFFAERTDANAGGGGAHAMKLIGLPATNSTGGNTPHNNMPPFIPLYFCKYVGTS